MTFPNENALRHHVFDTGRQMGIHGIRIEMPEQPGMPDTVLSKGPLSCWTELKIGLPDYRPGQLPWAIVAGNNGLIVRTLGSMANEFYLIDQHKAGLFKLEHPDATPRDFADLMSRHSSIATLLVEAFHDVQNAASKLLPPKEAAPIRVEA